MKIFNEEELEKIEKDIIDTLKELKRTSRSNAQKIIEEAIENAIN